LDGELRTQTQAVYIIDGVPLANGHPDANVFASDELIANPSGCAAGRHEIAGVKAHFPGAKVVA
jgi:hypothetical protein